MSNQTNDINGNRRSFSSKNETEFLNVEEFLDEEEFKVEWNKNSSQFAKLTCNPVRRFELFQAKINKYSKEIVY